MINHRVYRSLRKATYDVIENNEYQTPVSRLFDRFLITLILLNVAAVIAESVDRWYYPNQELFELFEWFSIIIFSAEYWLRFWSIVEKEFDDEDVNDIETLNAKNNYDNMPNWKRRLLWVKSPGAIVDFISIFPAYLNFFVTVDLRFLRVLRLFRLLKLTRYFAAMRILLVVLNKEKESFKAVVFILIIMIVTASSGIYVVENQAQPEVFESIPKSMWWAVVTLTTVGYGDVIPITVAGKILGAVITILGVGLAALPAGILASGLAAELAQRRERLEQKFQELLLSEDINLLENHQKIEKLRLEMGLNKEQAHQIVLDLLRDKEFEEKAKQIEHRNYCPHCGEKL